MQAAAAIDCEDALTQTNVPHRPVLLRESLALLRPAPGATVVDVTLGPGGHAEALLELIGPNGRVIGIDRDPRRDVARQHSKYVKAALRGKRSA